MDQFFSSKKMIHYSYQRAIRSLDASLDTSEFWKNTNESLLLQVLFVHSIFIHPFFNADWMIHLAHQLITQLISMLLH